MTFHRRINRTKIRKCMITVYFSVTLLLIWCPASPAATHKQQEITVLDKTVFGVAPHDMMKSYLTEQVDKAAADWAKNFEKLKTKEDIIANQQRLRREFEKAIGEFPERTPLNAKVAGVLKRPGYRVEKLLYESRPRHYVSAICFVPESQTYKPPHPGVLVPCGHSQNGKAYQSYQSMGALLALNGMVALVFDPIEQGERLQIVDDNGKSQWWGVHAHNRIGVGCAFLGQGTATFEIWDGMRGIDYLQSRPDVDAERIGCTGNSGGGTQTSQLMALEDRIDVAGPSCYLTSFERLVHTIGGQDAEQNIYGQLAFGMDHADYITMRAPSPVIIAAGIRDFFDIEGTRLSYRYAKRLFTQLGAQDNVALFENDAGHNYNTQQREAIVTFFARFLQGRTEPVVEPEIQVFTDEQLQCSPQGQVMLMDGARCVYDINADYAKKLAAKRRKLWKNTPPKQLIQNIRSLVGVRHLNELPKTQAEEKGTIQRNGYTIKKLLFAPEEGIVLPALHFVPGKSASKRPALYLHEAGKIAEAGISGEIESLVLEGREVLAVDVRGCGETQQKEQGYFSPEYGGDGRDVIYAYLLGRSYVQMRCEDILVCSGYLSEVGNAGKGVDLIAVGNLGVPALHAAVLEKDLFASVTIRNMIRSWTHVASAKHTTNQMINFVYGALHLYDLPNLINLIGPENVRISSSVDPDGNKVFAD